MNKTRKTAFKEFHVQEDEINYKYYNKYYKVYRRRNKTTQWLKAETGPNYLKPTSSTH